jgi:hypothetical protein
MPQLPDDHSAYTWAATPHARGAAGHCAGWITTVLGRAPFSGRSSW